MKTTKADRAGNVVSIYDSMRHIVQECICTECGYRWIDCRPFTVTLVSCECPKCKVTGFVIATGCEVLFNEKSKWRENSAENNIVNFRKS